MFIATTDFIIFIAEGTRPDPKRGEDLQNALEPHNASEVQSLLEMTNYSCKYIKAFATIIAPLRVRKEKCSWEQIKTKTFGSF